MGIVRTISKQLAAASANNICQSQTPSGPGNLVINGAAASGGVATLDTQRRVLFTFAADESGHNFVVYGTKQGGAEITETVVGTTAGTVATKQDFLKITRITIDAAATGAITVGTNGVGATDWQSVDLMREPVNVGLGTKVSGTVNYSVQFTYDEINRLLPGVLPTVFDHLQLASQTGDQSAMIDWPVAYFRLQVNSGDGEASLTYQQAGP